LLEDLAQSGETDAVRLRALDLLDRLDEREGADAQPPSSAELGEAFAAELAEDTDRLERVAQLYLESGALQPLIEERARELAEQLVEASAVEARSSFAIVRDEEALGAREPNEAQVEPSERPREARDAAVRLLRDPWPDDPPEGETVIGRVRRARGGKPDVIVELGGLTN
jgi:hypothetical protein